MSDSEDSTPDVSVNNTGPQTSFYIATMNTYNLNTTEHKVYSHPPWTKDQYRRKIEFMRSKVLQLPADVWGFQELWHPDALTDVFDHPDLRDKYTLLVPKEANGKQVVCAAAVRKDIYVADSLQLIRSFPKELTHAFGRGADDIDDEDDRNDGHACPKLSINLDAFRKPVLRFLIRLRIYSEPIMIYVTHLKSKGPTKVMWKKWFKDNREFYQHHAFNLGSTFSTFRRTAEAAALRMILTEAMRGNKKPVIVVGDLNDGQHSNTLDIISGCPNYLETMRESRNLDTDLFAVGTLQQFRSRRDVYFTHVHQGLHESLDHILVSQSFYDHSPHRVFQFLGMDIHNDHLTSKNHVHDGTTDHGVVRARFVFDPAKR